jgi:hypothetical protein
MLRYLNILIAIGLVLFGLFFTVAMGYRSLSGDFMLPSGLSLISYFITLLLLCIIPALLGVALLYQAFRQGRKQGKDIQP